MQYDESYNNIVKITPTKAISYDTINSQYIFQKYDNVASQYIDSVVSTIDVDDSIFGKINMQLSAIFPGRNVNIMADGIKESAEGWV